MARRRRIKIEEIEALAKTFLLERILYGVVCVLGFVLLVSLCCYFVVKGLANWKCMATLFCPTGFIGISCARILKVWNDSIEILKNNE